MRRACDHPVTIRPRGVHEAPTGDVTSPREGVGTVEYRILGPLEVAKDGRPVAIGGGRRRSLLALLLLHANEVVPAEHLVDELWPEDPPETAQKAVQNHVSVLRKELGEAVATRGRGYELRVEPGALDLHRFEELAEEGRRALSANDPAEAAVRLREALTLWRGPALADCGPESFARAERSRLEDLRQAALEDRIEADLALGRHADVAGELESLVTRHPLRERLRSQLMLALYRSGRQAEALAAYQDARRTLTGELGLDPSAQLQELERAVLAHDPALDLAVMRSGATRPARRLRFLVAAGLLLVAGAVGAILAEVVGSSSKNLAPVAPNSLAAVDPGSGRVVAEIPVGARPAGVVFGSGSLWVANLDDRSVSRVDPGSDAVLRTIALGDAPGGLAATRDAVWAAGTTPAADTVKVRRIDPTFDAVTRTVEIASFPQSSTSLAAAPDALWVAPSLGLLTRIDPASNAAVRELDIGSSPTAAAVGADAVWVADPLADTVTRVDPTGALSTVAVGHGPSALAVGAGGVWVADTLDDAVVRIDLETRAVTTTIHVGQQPVAVAVGKGSVWVANGRDGTISEIDPARLEVAKTIPVGGSPAGLAFANGRLWVTVEANVFVGTAPASKREHGVLRINSQDDFDSLDPAFAFVYTSWQVEYATCAKLLNYPDRPAPQGSRLEPEVAEALPKRSADGRTYTFTIRPGFRFSPPSSQRVTAATFKYTIERALSPKIKSPARLFASDIAGAAAYEAGRTPHISGLFVSGRRLTVKLVRSSGDLPARLSLPFFCAVPVGTPVDPHGLRSVPSAGPYYVTSYEPGQGLVLKANPNYGGGRPRRIAEIDVTTDVSGSKSVAAIEAGAADYALDGVPVAADGRLARRYGAGSRRRYFVRPQPLTYFLALNTSRPLFSDVQLRRAVNYAIDRTALARLGIFSNHFEAKPTDRYLPPGIPGYRDVRVYPLHADAPAARRLANGGGRTAVLYTCNVSACAQGAKIIERNLAAIGLRVEVHAFPLPVLFGKVGTRDEPFDLATVGWQADYPDPADFLNLLLDGRSIHASGNVNFAYLDDPRWNAKLAAAARLSGPRRYRAYARLETEIVRDAAPWVAIANPTSRDFFSARVGCEVVNPIYGVDLAALCERG